MAYGYSDEYGSPGTGRDMALAVDEGLGIVQ